MNINSVRVNDIWCHFEILNVKSTDKNGKIEESDGCCYFCQRRKRTT